MASFEVRWKRSAVRDLRRIDRPIIPRIIETVDGLLVNPWPKGCRRLRETRRHYRVHVGDYRIIYEVLKESRLIVVHYVRHRKDAYRPR